MAGHNRDIDPVHRSGMASDAGGRELNEDSCTVRDLSHRRVRKYLCLMAVADGMGGHNAGDVASRVAVDMLWDLAGPDRFADELDFEGNVEQVLWNAFSAINSHIYDLGRASPEKSGMGTTLTCALVGPEGARIAHVGDSRAYLVSSGGVRQVTGDHSVVGKMVADGVLTEEQAMSHEQRNVITRAIGPAPNVEIDIFEIKLSAGDIVFLCSDGLTNVVTCAEIAGVLGSGEDVQAACEKLVGLAVSRGTTDNATAAAWMMPDLSQLPRTRRGGGREPSRWAGLPAWAVVLLAALMITAGFGIAWGVMYAVRSGKPAATSPGASRAGRTVPRVESHGFKPGDAVRIDTSSGEYILRDKPKAQGGVEVARLADGTKLEVLGATEDADGSRWYKVRVTDSAFAGRDVTGFAKSDFLARSDGSGR